MHVLLNQKQQIWLIPIIPKLTILSTYRFPICWGPPSQCWCAQTMAVWNSDCASTVIERASHSHLPPTAPPRGPRPLTCGVSSECSGTRSYETTSRDQRGKIQMFFSSTGACTATKFPIANHRSSIVARLYFASVTQMFLMPLFVKVESDSSKLLRTVSKSGPNACQAAPASTASWRWSLLYHTCLQPATGYINARCIKRL